VTADKSVFLLGCKTCVLALAVGPLGSGEVESPRGRRECRVEILLRSCCEISKSHVVVQSGMCGRRFFSSRLGDEQLSDLSS
jgi:hypothetical protein